MKQYKVSPVGLASPFELALLTLRRMAIHAVVNTYVHSYCEESGLEAKSQSAVSSIHGIGLSSHC